MERLLAEESLRAATQIAVGTGKASNGDAIRRSWQLASWGDGHRPAIKANPAMIRAAQIGIGHRRVKKAMPPSDVTH
jgi:hypothetical protein